MTKFVGKGCIKNNNSNKNLLKCNQNTNQSKKFKKKMICEAVRYNKQNKDLRNEKIFLAILLYCAF